jgi:hypothetical protein
VKSVGAPEKCLRPTRLLAIEIEIEIEYLNPVPTETEKLMKLNRKLLVVALASALPWMSAYAQSPADLQKEIELLKGQLKMLSEKIEAMSVQAEPAAITQQVTRLEQKMDLAEEDAIKSGLKGLKIKGTMEIAYLNDSSSSTTGFDKSKGNGGFGDAMLEVSKEPDVGIGWTLRLIPLSGTGSIVHEASVSVPLGESGVKLIAGLTPDWSGYEYSMGNQNPLITNNLLYSNLAATNYMGVGTSHDFGGGWTGKWMLGQVDGVMSRKAPGIAYRGDYSMGEYSGIGFSGVHIRTNDEIASPGTNADLMEIDGYYTRGDLSLQGQISLGRLIGGSAGAAYDTALVGTDGKWWGLSGFLGYKVTPRLQAIARLDYVNNRENGGGVYFNDGAYGPELDSSGTPVDASVGANRYALSTGLNYAINGNTAWKTELRLDKSSGYNFVDSNGVFKQSKTTIGTSIVVSF